LIYEFYKKKHPNLKRILEEEGGHLEKPLQPDEIEAKHVTEAALKYNDELCLHVIKKFVEIYAVETGNFALKTLPYGGIFLVGGVTNAIHSFLNGTDFFQETFFFKGRFSSMMRRFPLMLVRPEIELGIQGSEECAFREFGCFKNYEE
jgi:glucokinase